MQFTCQMLFDITIGLMNEQRQNSISYSEFILPVINTVLSELLEDENAFRKMEGTDTLDEAPYMTDLNDIIPYHRELIQNVMPFGVGLYLYLGDDEMTKATYFSTKYDENRRKYAVAIYVDTSEVFSSGI